MTKEPSLPEDLAEYAEVAARPRPDRHRPWLPVVAVLLGTLFVGERIGPAEMLAMLVIVGAVAQPTICREYRSITAARNSQPS